MVVLRDRDNKAAIGLGAVSLTVYALVAGFVTGPATGVRNTDTAPRRAVAVSQLRGNEGDLQLDSRH